MQSDGKIIIAGQSGASTTVLVRYNSNGLLDTSFDSDGIVTTANSHATGMVIQGDGKIVVVSDGNDYSLTRYTTNGSLDTGFGTNGTVITSVGGFDSAIALTLDTIGNILVTGYTEVSKASDVFISRHTSNGALDPIFDGGGDGIVITDIGTFLDESHAITMQTDGKIVLAGKLRNSSTADDLAVLRYIGTVPTAANVTLGGRITNSVGSGVPGVWVILSGGALSQPQSTLTSSFGYYNFYDVPVGHTYVVTPDSNRYSFTPTNRVITLMDEFLGADFTATEN